MTKIQRKSMIIICIIFFVGAGVYFPFYPVTAYPTYPQTGIIAMWTGSTIPTGWAILSSVNDRFVLGTSTGETPGATGGSIYHRHIYTETPIHNHGSTSTSSLSHYHSFSSGSTIENKGTPGSDIQTFYTQTQISTGNAISTHVHTIYGTGYSTCYTEDASTLPVYQTVSFIKKVSPTAPYPAGLIVISTGGAVPQGWVLCDGSNGTPDLRGDFLRGSSTPGLIGGSTTHSHAYSQVPYHSHTMNEYGGSHNHGAVHGTTSVEADTWATFAYDVVVAVAGQSSDVHYTHSHSISATGSTSCNSQSTSHLPPYTIVDFLMSTNDMTALPEGVVALWDGISSSIPYGWAVCDGSSGTLDLRDRFLRGRMSEAIGTRSGSTSHSHIYSCIPQHTHAVSSVDAYHAHAMNVYGGIAVGAETLFGLGSPVYTSGGSDTTTSSVYYHYHNTNSAGVSNPSMQTQSNFPPYIKLTYIKCIDYEADAPVFTSLPNDGALEYGYYSGESISWGVIDAHPDIYTIELLGTGIVAGPSGWIPTSLITYDIPNGLAIGTYTYEIDVFDKYSRPNTDSVTLTVQDTTNPFLIDVPNPLTVELGYTGQSFSWTATEFNPDYYQIERLDIGLVVGPTGWSSGNPVTYNIPNGLAVDMYSYKITFIDDYGNSDWDIVEFNVVDTTGPIIEDAPSDVVFEYGNTGPILAWNVTDPNPDAYTINLDGIPFISGIPWSSLLPIEFDTTPLNLEAGEHIFILNVSDIYGNYNLDSVTVTVEDTTTPVIETYASDLVVELGYTGQNFSWNATDPYTGTYFIELEDTGIVAGPSSWSSGRWISYSIPNGMPVGVYVYTLNVTDLFGNSVTHLVTFTVEPDTTTPLITNNPEDLTVNLGYRSQSFTWIATDLFPDTYIIELEGTGMVVSHTRWTSGEEIIFNIPEGLSGGTYIYSITFYDESGNSVIDAVIFTVETPPRNIIPGYEVSFIMGISACSVLALYLIFKKKTKN